MLLTALIFDSFAGGVGEAMTILVDAIAIAALTYALLNALRNTPALPFLLSLGILGGVYFVIDWLDLKGLKRIFGYAPQWLVIAVIVLFQEDIRRLVLKANPNNLVRRLLPHLGAAGKAELGVIEVIVRASTTLSSKGLGALIVFDKEQDLGEYTTPDNSIPVDSVLSSEILHAIFIDRFANPLHDGATVINTERIVAAACFLPLTNRLDIDPTLGTRHRAAIGLSEETGAVVVVVSEETRKITICYQGRYQRFSGTEGDEVREELQRVLRAKTASERNPKSGE